MAECGAQPLTDACGKFRRPKCDGRQTGLRTTRLRPPQRILPELPAASRWKVARQGRTAVVRKAVDPGRALYRSDARNPRLASPKAPQARLARRGYFDSQYKFSSGYRRSPPGQKICSRGDLIPCFYAISVL